MTWRQFSGNFENPINPEYEQEARLVEQARAGSERAFSALLARYQQPVFRLIFYLVGEEDDARDLARIALKHALLHMPRVPSGYSIRPWLLRVAVLVALDAVRERSESPQQLLANMQLPAPPQTPKIVDADPTMDDTMLLGVSVRQLAQNPQTAVADAWDALPIEIERELIRRLLAGLPEGDAELLALGVVGQVPTRDLAALAGTSQRSIRRRIARALILFQGRYQEVRLEALPAASPAKELPHTAASPIEAVRGAFAEAGERMRRGWTGMRPDQSASDAQERLETLLTADIPTPTPTAPLAAEETVVANSVTVDHDFAPQQFAEAVTIMPDVTQPDHESANSAPDAEPERVMSGVFDESSWESWTAPLPDLSLADRATAEIPVITDDTPAPEIALPPLELAPDLEPAPADDPGATLIMGGFLDAIDPAPIPEIVESEATVAAAPTIVDAPEEPFALLAAPAILSVDQNIAVTPPEPDPVASLDEFPVVVASDDAEALLADHASEVDATTPAEPAPESVALVLTEEPFTQAEPDEETPFVTLAPDTAEEPALAEVTYGDGAEADSAEIAPVTDDALDIADGAPVTDDAPDFAEIAPVDDEAPDVAAMVMSAAEEPEIPDMASAPVEEPADLELAPVLVVADAAHIASAADEATLLAEPAPDTEEANHAEDVPFAVEAPAPEETTPEESAPGAFALAPDSPSDAAPAESVPVQMAVEEPLAEEPTSDEFPAEELVVDEPVMTTAFTEEPAQEEPALAVVFTPEAPIIPAPFLVDEPPVFADEAHPDAPEYNAMPESHAAYPDIAPAMANDAMPNHDAAFLAPIADDEPALEMAAPPSAEAEEPSLSAELTESALAAETAEHLTSEAEAPPYASDAEEPLTVAAEPEEAPDLPVADSEAPAAAPMPETPRGNTLIVQPNQRSEYLARHRPTWVDAGDLGGVSGVRLAPEGAEDNDAFAPPPVPASGVLRLNVVEPEAVPVVATESPAEFGASAPDIPMDAADIAGLVAPAPVAPDVAAPPETPAPPARPRAITRPMPRLERDVVDPPHEW